MLVLTRKEGEKIIIGDVIISIVSVRGKSVRIGIDAPKEIKILREELKH
jgi:carbon storage regulator